MKTSFDVSLTELSSVEKGTEVRIKYKKRIKESASSIIPLKKFPLENRSDAASTMLCIQNNKYEKRALSLK